MDRRAWKPLAALVLALAFVLVASSKTYAQLTVKFGERTEDPRVGQIKAELEKAGFKVFEVGFASERPNRAPAWAAVTAATYATPTQEAMLKQAFNVWDVLYKAVSKDNPKTILFSGQVWTKYMMVLALALGDATAFVSSVGAAKSEDEKTQALRTLVRQIRFEVMDLERQQFVDRKDFINKNFSK